MKIGAVLSHTLLNLLEKNSIRVDYVEVNGSYDLDTLQRVLALRPVLLHDLSNDFWLNYEDPFDEQILAKARAMLDLANPPWHSTGIGASAEPQGHTTRFWRGAPESARQPRERCLANIARNGRRLAEWLGRPLLLENYNYHPTHAYDYICEPDTFSQLIEEIGCGVLLDLAHAQISAFNLGWADPHDYVSALPLDRVREIHLNHPEIVTGDPALGDQEINPASQADSTWGSSDHARKQMLDRHFPVQESDLDLLRWTLERTPHAEAITLESEPASESDLQREMDLLHTLEL